MSSWGTGYVPPNAEQAGAARHRTERWEPQAEGKQQEGTFKPLIKNQPHQSTRGTQVLEAKAPASRTQSCLGSIWTLMLFWDVRAAWAVLSAMDTARTAYGRQGVIQ